MSFRSVRQWLVDRAWLDQTLLEGPGFEALVRERMRELGCEGESDYLQHLRADAGEIDRVTAAIAVPETWLFRYPASFDLLVDFLRRRRIADASSVRLLSLGCASGEDAVRGRGGSSAAGHSSITRAFSACAPSRCQSRPPTISRA